MGIQESLQMEVERSYRRAKQKIFYALVLLGAVYIVAIEMYHYVEGWDWLDAVYFTTATITTVGYGDVVPHTELGKMATIPLMLVGVGVGFYVIFAIQGFGRSRLDAISEHVDRQVKRRRGRL